MAAALGSILALTLAILIYRFIIYPILFSPLAKIPSAHWSAPLSRFWILHTRFHHRENRTLLEAHRRLGPVVRVGPTDLSIDDVDLVRTVYGGGFEKTDWYSVFDNYGVPCMFSTREAKEHSLRKRMISNVYSKSYIQSSEASKAQARVILFDRLLPLLRESAAESQLPHGINVHSIFLATTMDFISAYIFGISSSTNFIQNVAYREHWLQLYMSRHDYPFFPQELPKLTRFLRRIGFSPYPHWVDAANEEMGVWNQKLCSAALDSISSAQTKRSTDSRDESVVLNAFLAGIQKEEKANGKESLLYSTAILRHDLTVNSELFDHVLAGQETAGVTLTYLTWQLSKDQSLQKKLHEELLSLEPSLKTVASGQGCYPEPRALDALPVLHAVLMETLRLYAALPGPLPRQTPHPSCQLGPYRVPGGVRVAALAHTLHRHRDIFPDPERFDHSRWLDEDARKERTKNFWAFSSGGRMCIGSNFAMHEMKLIVAAIYSNFQTHIVDDAGMEQTDGYELSVLDGPRANDYIYASNLFVNKGHGFESALETDETAAGEIWYIKCD